MGVNIGALDMVLMRNVPPRAANYWQRAGRAGREERMAVVLTYCRRSQHDRYSFEDPLRLLGGAIEAPSFNLRNPVMLAKHVRSAVLSDLLLRSQRADRHAARVEDVLKQLFPTFIRGYLLDPDDQFLDAPTSAVPLAALLGELRDELAGHLVELFGRHWPEEAADLVQRDTLAAVLDAMPADLDQVLWKLHRRVAWARSQRDEMYGRMQRRLAEREEEQLFYRCDRYIKSIMRCDRETYSLRVLAELGFLPGYAVSQGGRACGSPCPCRSSAACGRPAAMGRPIVSAIWRCTI